MSSAAVVIGALTCVKQDLFIIMQSLHHKMMQVTF